MSSNTIIIIAEFLIFKAVQSQYYYGQPSYPTSYYNGYTPSYYYPSSTNTVPPDVTLSYTSTRPGYIPEQTPQISKPPNAPALSNAAVSKPRTSTSLNPTTLPSYTYPVSSASLVPSGPSPPHSTSTYSGSKPLVSTSSLSPTLISTFPYSTQSVSVPSSLPYSVPPIRSSQPPPSIHASISHPVSHSYPSSTSPASAENSPYLTPNSEIVPSVPPPPYPYPYSPIRTKPSPYYSSPLNYTYPYYASYREDRPVESPPCYSSSSYSTSFKNNEDIPPPVYNCPFCNGFKDVKPPPGKNIAPPPPSSAIMPGLLYEMPTIADKRQDCPCRYEQRELESEYVPTRYSGNLKIPRESLQENPMPRQYLYSISSQEKPQHEEYQHECQRWQHSGNERYQRPEDQHQQMQYRPILSYSDYENRMVPKHRYEESKTISKPQELFQTLVKEIENRLSSKLNKIPEYDNIKPKFHQENYAEPIKYDRKPKEYDLVSRRKEYSSPIKEDNRSRKERSDVLTSEPSSRRSGFNQPPTLIDPNDFEQEDAFSKYTSDSTPVRNSRPDLELLDAFMACVGKPQST